MTRQVRITLEGDATDVVDSHGHPTGCLRVRYAPARGELPAASVFVDTRAESVTVEDVTPERQWTDGDVIASTINRHVWTRVDGQWLRSDGNVRPMPDATATRTLERLAATVVLRYQAGE